MADASPSSSDHQKLIDRLSNLPQHILLHILSFLPTKMAAKTSVLSKPWQHLWTLVPAIDLDDPTFDLNDDGYPNDAFEQSVSKVLLRNKAIPRRFCLRGKYCTTSSLDKWLSYATEHNVEELDLTFGSVHTIGTWSATLVLIKLRMNTQSFKTLVVMKLRMNTRSCYVTQFVINIGENLEGYFPALKVLHLCKVWFEGGDPSLSGIFALRFPLLEELEIYETEFHHDINISLPKLKRFRIDSASLKSLGELRLNMDAPSLHCLVLHGFGSGGFREDYLHNLLDASLASRFPLLEELVVETATFRHDINISLPKLRRLEIRRVSLGQYTLNIEAPSLEYLDLICFDSAGFRAVDLPNLVEANVEVWCSKGDEKHYEYGESLINFINALFNARRLNFSSCTMWEFQNASSLSFLHNDRIQPFHNLVKLDLELDSYALGILMIMLSKFQNLEHLKITNCSSGSKGEKTEYSLASPTYVPNCLIYHLKTFCYENFNCSKYEMEFTIYILKNSSVLENVKILFTPRLVWKKGSHSRKILSTTSRGSLKCNLKFDQEVSGYEDIDSYSDYSDYSE